MAFAYKINRVTMSGTSFGGEEQWSTGFYMGYTAGDANLPQQSVVDAIGPLWQTFFLAASSKIHNQWQTTEVKIVQLAVNGTTVPDSQVYYTYPAPISGGGGAGVSVFPPQIALVATLVGPQARGLASKGRMFLPGVTAAVNANGRISDADRGTICTNVRTFLRGVTDIPGEDNVPMLASQGRGLLSVGAINHEVISVRVGNVYDTQRRRRNALTEAYSTVVL